MVEQRSFDANVDRSTAVAVLEHELRNWRRNSVTGDDHEKAKWIVAVNDTLLRLLPGVQIAFMVSEMGSHVETEQLDLALFVPAYLTRLFLRHSVVHHPSVIVELGTDGSLTTLKNRYGSQRTLDSVQGAVTLSDPGAPPVIVFFTTQVPTES